MNRTAPAVCAALALGLLTPGFALAQGVVTEMQIGRHGDAITGQIGAFLPFIDADGTIVYGHFRGGVQSTGIGYGTLGVGVRREFAGDWTLGGHMHLGMSGTALDNSFQQAILGVEAFYGALELRANAYLPIGNDRKRSDAHSVAVIEAGQLGVRQGYEQAMAAVDVEAGLTLPVDALSSDASLKLFAGAYAQFAHNLDTVYGVSGRAELDFARIGGPASNVAMTLGAGASYDALRGTNASVYGRLSFGIGGADATQRIPAYARVGFTPYVTTQAGAFGDLQTALTADGRAVGAVRTIDQTTGDLAAINDVLRAAGDNAILLASGQLVVDDTLLLGAGQTWLGGGGTIELTGQDTGTRVAVSNAGPRAKVMGTNAASDVFLMNDGSSILNTDISGGNTAIRANAVSNVAVADVSITGAAAHGIALDDVAGVAIRNASITGLAQCDGCGYTYSTPDIVSHAGVFARGTSNLAIDGLAIDASTYGVFIASRVDASGSVMESKAQGITLSNIDIRNTRQEALMVAMADDVTITDLAIDNTAMALTKDSVVFLNTTNASLDRADIAGGINGVMIATAPISAAWRSGDIRVENVNIRDTTLGGLFINPSDNVTFRNIAMERMGSDSWSRGIFMLAMGSDVISGLELENVSIDGTGIGMQIMANLENVQGDVSVTGAATECSFDAGPWSGSLTQAADFEFSVNGRLINPAPSGPLC